MKRYKIIIEDIEIEAKDMEEAENQSMDIVNDIGHDGAYEIKEIKNE